LATEIPGPASTAAMQRRKEAVSGGLGTAMPVIVDRAQCAIIEDIDGKQGE
jgi:4-aminobutyrate aminotransferase/(S)-3-amino-2-methylpropionate transaminase